MHDESLKQLLEQADAAPKVTDPQRIASGVRRRRTAERRLRTTASAVAVLLAVMVGMLVNHQRSTVEVARVQGVSSAQLQQELVNLAIDAQLHESTALAMWTKERARLATARANAEKDPLAEIRFQQDRAAMTLVYEAERFSRRPLLAGRAVTQYRRVIELFPSSSWADVARQRLRDIQS